MDDKFLKLLSLLRSDEFADKCITCQFLYKHPLSADMRHFQYTGFTHEIMSELKKRFGILVPRQYLDGSVKMHIKWTPIQIMGDVSFNYVLQLSF